MNNDQREIAAKHTAVMHFALQLAMQEYAAKKIRELYGEIKHGDADHQKWLKDKIESFIEKNMEGAEYFQFYQKMMDILNNNRIDS